MPSLSYCAEQVKSYDYERYLCGLFYPAEVREDLYALYAFNLETARAAEMAGEEMVAFIRLAWWRDALDGMYARHSTRGSANEHPVAAALQRAVRTHRLSREYFDCIVDARARDMETRRPPEDMDALCDYAQATEGALARLRLQLLHVRGEPPLRLSDALARAWALNVLLRAVPRHARRGRVYLPETLLRKHGLSERDIIDGARGAHQPEALAAAVREMAEGVETLLRDIERRLGKLEMPSAMHPVLLERRAVRFFLRRLSRGGWNVFAPEIARPAASGALALRLLWHRLIAKR